MIATLIGANGQEIHCSFSLPAPETVWFGEGAGSGPLIAYRVVNDAGVVVREGELHPPILAAAGVTPGLRIDHCFKDGGST